MQHQSFQIRFMANIYEFKIERKNNDFLRINVKITEIIAINRKKRSNTSKRHLLTLPELLV